MTARCGGNLWHMGDRNNLSIVAQRTHFRSDRMRNFAADIRIDLVKNQQTDEVLLRENGLDRQHHARNFAAGRNRSQRLQRFSWVRRKQELDRLKPRRTRFAWRINPYLERGLSESKIFQMCLDCFRKTSRRTRSGTGQLVPKQFQGVCFAQETGVNLREHFFPAILARETTFQLLHQLNQTVFVSVMLPL